MLNTRYLAYSEVTCSLPLRFGDDSVFLMFFRSPQFFWMSLNASITSRESSSRWGDNYLRTYKAPRFSKVQGSQFDQGKEEDLVFL